MIVSRWVHQGPMCARKYKHGGKAANRELQSQALAGETVQIVGASSQKQHEGERVMWKKAAILVKLELGGYIVKEHDVYNNQTAILFAGSLNDCLEFLEDYMLMENE